MTTWNELDKKAISALRALLIDEINAANSGHPGMALDIAPTLYVLYRNHLVADPSHPNWLNRDRFVLSSGHNSALLYALLHLAKYDVTIDDLKQFRQLNSRTPGHPEIGVTPGVDATSGPLGQGIAQALGMAMAEEKVRASYPDGSLVMNHYTYCLCGDGCLEEGISQEAISLAGHLKLEKLILLYDANTSTLDGPTSNSMTEDIKARFIASEWDVFEVNNGEDIVEIDEAITKAKKSSRPAMILIHTLIGYGSKNQGSHKTHGSPLGEEDGANTKAFFNWTLPPFKIPADVYEALGSTFAKRGALARKEYDDTFEKYKTKYPKESSIFLASFARDFSSFDLSSPEIVAGKAEATRSSSGRYLQKLATNVPFTFGGSADVAGSLKTDIPGDPSFSAIHRYAKNINFGIREFAMAAAMNGMVLHGGVVPYVGSFLVFSDYMKNAIRMAALEEIPSIYLLSHDSIAVGEDGPTHEPIEQIASLRLIPNLEVFRPADTRETFASWKEALLSKDHPTCLILSRQNLPYLGNSSSEGTKKGAYIIYDCGKKPDFEFIATGSEVSSAIEVAKLLAEEGYNINVISMPCVERYRKLSIEEKKSILSLPKKRRIAIEMASGLTWYEWADYVISQDTFGKSGKDSEVLTFFGWDISSLKNKALALVKEALSA